MIKRCLSALPRAVCRIRSQNTAIIYMKKRYAEWIEIHSLVGFSINEMDKMMLKEIAASDPEALIPAYHREVAFSLIRRTT